MLTKNHSKQHRKKQLWIKPRRFSLMHGLEIFSCILSGFLLGWIAMLCVCFVCLNENVEFRSLAFEKGADAAIALLFTYYLGLRIDKSRNVSEKIWNVLSRIDASISEIIGWAMDSDNWMSNYDSALSRFETIVSDVYLVRSMVRRSKYRHAKYFLDELDVCIAKMMSFLNNSGSLDRKYKDALHNYFANTSSLIRKIMFEII